MEMPSRNDRRPCRQGTRGRDREAAGIMSRTAAHAHAGVWAGVNRSEPTRGLVDEVCGRARRTSSCGADEIMTGKGHGRL
jgi:hypothetical protein